MHHDDSVIYRKPLGFFSLPARVNMCVALKKSENRAREITLIALNKIQIIQSLDDYFDFQLINMYPNFNVNCTNIIQACVCSAKLNI